MLNLISGELFLAHQLSELGPSFEEMVQRRDALGLDPRTEALHSRNWYVYLIYARISQAMAGIPSGVPGLERALGQFAKAAHCPMFVAHLEVGRAALEMFRGRPARAERLLDRAEAVAREADSPWAAWEAQRIRARLALAAGHASEARRLALGALAVASDAGWVPRAMEVQREFDVALVDTGGTSSVAVSLSDSARVDRRGQLLAPRTLDALLEVNLASAGVMDPAEQYRLVLDAIVRVLHAERAFLFLATEGTEALVLSAGRSATGEDLTALRGYASTVVEMVRSRREPKVVSGTEEGVVLGSQSAVANDLRSILAAPLQLRERFLGVVYLDSRVAKGLFREEDLGILAALSTHIAIALETRRAATQELERVALERDLAVTATVQSLLLPAEDAYRSDAIRMVSVYRPAAQSGGDWWSYESRPDGEELTVYVGDVTGHGAGAAMVTAGITGRYRTLSAEVRHEPRSAMLAIHDTLFALTGGRYHMTLCGLHVDAQRGVLRWVNAGSPSVMVLRAQGTVEVLSAPGHPLGGEKTPAFGEVEHPFRPGDRAFVFTDGVLEMMTHTGAQLGLKRLRKLILETLHRSPEEARAHLTSALDALRRGAPDDDLTLLIVDAVAHRG